MRLTLVPLLQTQRELYDIPLESIREETLATVYRSAYLVRHGTPRTLRQMMIREGLTGVFAEMRAPSLDEEDLAYTREVVRPHVDSSHFPTVFACLYGDEAARSVGYPPMGLSTRAGYALALAEAREGQVEPEEALRQTVSG